MGVNFEGVIVPVVSPFRADESVDEAGFESVIERMLSAGVSGIVVGGTTGEYYAMSFEERLAQLTLGAKLVGERATLIAGCTMGASSAAVSLALHARDHGYDAVMLSPPPTSLPTQHELAAYVQLIADRSALPVVPYNYPARAGVEYGFECIDEIADHSGVVAIKESSGDFSRFLALQHRYKDRIEVICGSDDQAFDYMAWGAHSWLAGTANVLPAEHVAFTASMLHGDIELGRRQFDALLPFLQYMESGRYNSKVKAGMNHVGAAVGVTRPPLLGLTADELAELHAVIDEAIAAFGSIS